MSSDLWTALGEGWVFSWSSDEPQLDGDDAIVAAVEGELVSPEALLVTPTGPTVEPDVADPLAVYAALLRVAPGPFQLVGFDPELPAIPGDAVA